MDKCEQTLAWLDGLGIEYQLERHAPAYTMADMETFGLLEKGSIIKNLFLRDAKGKRHMLVCVAGDKHVNLKALGQTLGEKLSFASEERLQKHMGLQKGEVTPLGVYFNEGATVEVFLDKDLATAGRIGVHPCDNTATVFMSCAGLLKALKSRGNVIKEVNL
jgi:Ala-tRNA(Pro) deacylase